MATHLTPLGVFHTIISVLALLIGLVCLLKYGKIALQDWMGKGYVALTAIACVTAFGIRKTGHFTPGHVLAALTLVLVLAGSLAKSIRQLGSRASYAETLALSTSLFLSLIPTTIEVCTRLPPSQPLASGPDAPVVKMALLGWTVLYVLGVIYQVVKLRKNASG